MDPGLAALLGVVLGGGSALAVEVYRNRSMRRERLHDVRRVAFARLMALSARCDHEATMVARRACEAFAKDGVAPPIDPGQWPEGIAQYSVVRFENLSDELTLVYEEVRLVASATVADHAGALMTAVGNLGSEARSGQGDTADGFIAARGQAHEARSSLRSVMRRELGNAD